MAAVSIPNLAGDGRMWCLTTMAVGMYARAALWCGEFNRTTIPKTFVDAYATSRQAAAAQQELVMLGLFADEGDGYRLTEIQVGGGESRRYARLRAAAGAASKEQVDARMAFYGGVCWICREATADCVDHVKPIAKGGSKWPANLRPACTPCNSRKRDRWPFDRHETPA